MNRTEKRSGVRRLSYKNVPTSGVHQRVLNAREDHLFPPSTHPHTPGSATNDCTPFGEEESCVFCWYQPRKKRRPCFRLSLSVGKQGRFCTRGFNHSWRNAVIQNAIQSYH